MTGRYKAYPEYQNTAIDWLGNVPSHWTVARLKNTLKIKNGRDYKDVEVLTDGYPVYGSGGIFKRSSDYLYDGESVLFGRKGTVDKPLLVNGKFWTVDTMFYSEIAPKMDARFIHNQAMLFPYNLLSTNTALPSMTQEDLLDLGFVYPSFEEQQKIANFLDHETSKIDTLIDKQEKLIELLKEKRQAVISHAVTKGLNPDVPMKDSGVEWLGEVPEHWGVSQIKYKVKPGTSITYGIVQAGPHIEDGIPYIKTSDMALSSLPTSGYSKTSYQIDESYKRSKVFYGDVVVAIRASVGKCLPVPKELNGANLTQGTAKISPGKDLRTNYLVNYFASSPLQTHLNSISKGATFKEITLEMLRAVYVLLPPLKEQTFISDYLEHQTDVFDSLITSSAKQMDLLKERKTALILAAVTGKIDVRDWEAE